MDNYNVVTDALIMGGLLGIIIIAGLVAKHLDRKHKSWPEQWRIVTDCMISDKRPARRHLRHALRVYRTARGEYDMRRAWRAYDILRKRRYGGKV
jgi:hypothetical protein